MAHHPADSIAHQVHGVLKTLLGQALKYIEGRGGSVASLPKDTVSGRREESTSADKPPSAKVVVPSGSGAKGEDFAPPLDGSSPVEIDSDGEDFVGSSRGGADEDEETKRAKCVVLILRQEARMARAKYTSLFYLEELGQRRACDGGFVRMSDLPGGNKETTRNRIADLYSKKVVAKREKASRFEGITLTALGKKAYELLRGTGSGLTAINVGTPLRGT